MYVWVKIIGSGTRDTRSDTGMKYQGKSEATHSYSKCF